MVKLAQCSNSPIKVFYGSKKHTEKGNLLTVQRSENHKAVRRGYMQNTWPPTYLRIMFDGLWVQSLTLPCSIKMSVSLWPTEFKTDSVLCVCKYSKFLRSAWNNGLAIIISLDRQKKSWNLRRTTVYAQRWYNGFHISLTFRHRASCL